VSARIARGAVVATVLAAVAGPAPAQTPPPQLVEQCAASRSAVGDVPRGNRTGFGSALRPGGFAISGRDGVFLCSRAAAARRAQDRTAAPVSGQGMGLAAQADVRGTLRPTLFAMPQTQARLQAMVDRIAAAWPYPDAPRPKVLISANVGFNAEARADNTIVVWLGVFEGDAGQPATDLSDNDLYWLLGHEYAHLALNHAGRDEVVEGQRRFARDAARVYERGARLESTLRYADSSGALSGPAKLEVRDSREAHQRLRFIMDSMIAPMWGRAQEDEADVAGYDIVALLGQRPRTSLATGRFEASEQGRDAQLEEMNDRMEDSAETALADPTVQSALASGSFGAAFTSLAGTLGKSLLEGMGKAFTAWSSRDHRPARQREEGIEKYRAAAYERRGVVLTGGLVRTEVDAILASPELRQGLIAARAVAGAQDALNQEPSDTAGAMRQMTIALRTPFGREAYVLYWAARVELAQGRTEAAVVWLEKARNAPNVSPEAYRELARLYAVSGRIPQAMAVTAEGRRKIGDSDYFLPEDVRVASRTRNLDAVPPIVDQCRRTRREQIMLDCQNAALDVDYASLSDSQKRQLEDAAYWGTGEKQDSPKVPSLDELKGLGRLLGGG
jgi:hypothetical protein